MTATGADADILCACAAQTELFLVIQAGWILYSSQVDVLDPATDLLLSSESSHRIETSHSRSLSLWKQSC